MINFEPWQPACAEYLSDFAEGRFDEAGQFWVIAPESGVQVVADRGDLIIGQAGCDGIELCFRRGMNGVWAYHPINGEHVLIAPDLRMFERGWNDGSVTV